MLSPAEWRGRRIGPRKEELIDNRRGGGRDEGKLTMQVLKEGGKAAAKR